MTQWMPQPGERLFFVTATGNGPVHVQFAAESTSVNCHQDGRIVIELELHPDTTPLSLEEQLAVAVLRKDVVASLALADDVREKFVQPEGFRTREDLMREIEGLRKLADYRMGVIEDMNVELASMKDDGWPRE